MAFPPHHGSQVYLILLYFILVTNMSMGVLCDVDAHRMIIKVLFTLEEQFIGKMWVSLLAYGPIVKLILT